MRLLTFAILASVALMPAVLPAQAIRMAGPPSSSRGGGDRQTPEQERSRLLQQLPIDRSPSGILQARLEFARPPDQRLPEEPERPPLPRNQPGQPPDAEPIPQPGEPGVSGPLTRQHVEKLKADVRRKQFRQDVNTFRLNVVLGNWDEVRTYLEALPENDAKVAYARVLGQLGTKVNVNPRPELATLGAKADQQDQYLRPVEILALSDASLAAPDRDALQKLAKLIPPDAPPPEAFFAILENGTRYFGTRDLDARKRTAELLLNAGLLDRAVAYLPDAAEARREEHIASLNLVARYHAEAHQADQGDEHLPQAWSICLEIIGQEEAPLNERAEALYRALALIPELGDETGQAWLEKTFTDPAGEGFEILASVGTLTAQTRQLQSDDFRLEQLKLQAAAAKSLLGTEGIDHSAWAEVLTLYALNWIHEANYSYQRDQTTSIRPQMQVDNFGNVFYSQERVRYEGNGVTPVTAGDLLDCRPDDRWLNLIDEPVRHDCQTVMARLFLKAKEEDQAFPILKSLAAMRPDQVERLVRELITVWATNHNPNQQNRYRSSYYYFYGFNQRAETIPLTRSKQERNLVELADLVRRVRDLGLKESFEEEFSDAFIQAHSQAEVWRVEALESVFGKLDSLDPKTVAALLQRMRINLASLWPNPKLQEAYKTKRRDKELHQHVLKGYGAARGVASEALEREPDNWRLQGQLAAIDYEESNYESSLTPQTDHSTVKRRSLDGLAASAKAYAASLPLEKEEEESIEAFETWFYAALGSPDLGALKAHHQPVTSEFPKIKAALESLPEAYAARHLERFATTLNNRLANVSPDLKFRYLEGVTTVMGTHEQLQNAIDVYQYYKDLITEIELTAEIDGSDRVGAGKPFGLFVNIRHTQEIERESGGFQRYLQNQNKVSYAYNYGRPQEDYREKFEKAARAVLEEHFEMLSLTFHDAKVESRSDPAFGWRVTPYAYFLLKTKGPEVDSIPPIKLDLDFLDTSGYVVLPVSTSALAIDAAGEAEARPFRDLRVVLTLDERTAADEDQLYLEVKATAHGLVPEMDALLALPPDGFVVADVEDRELLVEELDAETDDGAPRSTHEWRLAIDPDPAAAPAGFTFPAVLAATAEEDGLLRQRYDDVDLISAEETVALGANHSAGVEPWQVLLIIFILGTAAAGVWFLLRRSGPEIAVDPGPEIPATLTPVTLLTFLERIHDRQSLDESLRVELEREIASLQDRYFGPARDEASTPNLHSIARRWKRDAA